MGVHGLLKNLGPPLRQSLATLSSSHYDTHNRSLRLAIDISIWLFQIQSGKGGSNPALRTFYYRLLRLLTLNIHPLFVFDGPNKPLFKRNKKVGGPGVRVASVPEFLAKQLLKQFGFPWHVAPGEAEAECALFQREGIVDAVLSEDVDTLMFGSGVTLRNWAAEAGKNGKTPTHIDVYRADETTARSGIDKEGMILVALMSGGDYLPEGISGCGPKVACDAARAGFGRALCALGRQDVLGLQTWKDKLEHEIKTNESKYFSRKNSSFKIPEDFPNHEVLGYYTHPCVSAPEKVVHLKRNVKWDVSIEFDALRSFAGDAFDWRCLGGAKKFIRNLAPAMLVRELRLKGESARVDLDQAAQEAGEKKMVNAIHGKRNHATTDGALEYRISFTPLALVPIDLDAEDEDAEYIPAGDLADESGPESENGLPPSNTPAGVPMTQALGTLSPTKRPRAMKPYDPSQPEKMWISKSFLQIGCPLLLELYEASFQDPKAFLKARRDARAAAKGDLSSQAASKVKRKTKKPNDMPPNALLTFTNVTKGISNPHTKQIGQSSQQGTDAQQWQMSRLVAACEAPEELNMCGSDEGVVHSEILLDHVLPSREECVATRTLCDLTIPDPYDTRKRRKPRSLQLSSPTQCQRYITSFYSPSPRRKNHGRGRSEECGAISLISSSPTKQRPATPTPQNVRHNLIRTLTPQECEALPTEWTPGELPSTVTKRRKRGPLRRHQTAPVQGREGDMFCADAAVREAKESLSGLEGLADAYPLNLDNSSPVSHCSNDEELESPSVFLSGLQKKMSGPRIPLSSQFVQQPLRVTSSLPCQTKVEAPTSTDVRSDQRSNHDLNQLNLNTVSNVPSSVMLPPLAKKKHIMLRESLPGAWKEASLEELDMTGDDAGNTTSLGLIGARRGWRVSAVGVVDLTDM